MLHEFLSDNRAELIERCGLKVAQRPSPKPTSVELEFGIPLFLDQLVKTLTCPPRSALRRRATASSC
jgi:hypothetical protein